MPISHLERLETLHRVSQALGSTLELDPLLETVMDQMIGVTGAERGFLMLGDSAEGMTFRVARGIDRKTIQSPAFQVSRGVMDRVVDSASPALVGDASSEAWLADRTSVSSLGLRSIMCVPLISRAACIGLVYVDNRLQAGAFASEDLDLLQTVAAMACVAIENARLHSVEIDQARLERELEVAREVQTSLIPQAAPAFPGYAIAGAWHAAREVAGDFYDFIPRPDGSLAVLIGDVTDKGVPAAFFMALARTSLRASLNTERSPQECITRANRLVCADAGSGMFVTLYLLCLGADGATADVVSAGHNPPLWVHAATGEVSALPKGSLPLGIEEGAPYVQHRLSIEPGDVVLLYTDGVTDAMDRNGEAFGLSRLKRVLRENHSNGAGEILSAVRNALEGFTGGLPQYDDVTLVGVKRA